MRGIADAGIADAGAEKVRLGNEARRPGLVIDRIRGGVLTTREDAERDCEGLDDRGDHE